MQKVINNLAKFVESKRKLPSQEAKGSIRRKVTQTRFYRYLHIEKEANETEVERKQCSSLCPTASPEIIRQTSNSLQRTYF